LRRQSGAKSWLGLSLDELEKNDLVRDTLGEHTFEYFVAYFFSRFQRPALIAD
jgi:hypothetical protein